MTPEEIDALTLGGYLPFDCPRCDRRRLEFFLNSDGVLCYCKCEKCGANSEDDSLSPVRKGKCSQCGATSAEGFCSLCCAQRFTALTDSERSEDE